MDARNARCNVMNAAYSAVALNLFTPFVKKMAIEMGANNLQLGYLSSWPSAASVVAVMGAAAAVARAKNKKRLIAAIFLLGRAAALGAAVVPWLPPATHVWALIFFWVLASFPQSAAGTVLQSFIADVFPEGERVRALASRQSWTTGVGMVVALGAGLLLDDVFPNPLGYQILFAVSFLFALIEVYYLMRMEAPAEPPARPARGPQPVRGLKNYIAVFQHKPFARFMAASLLFHFTWQMAWPLFDRFQITDLGADNTWLVILSVINSLVGVLTYPIWARMAERFGNLNMMSVAAVMMAAAPILNAVLYTIQQVALINFFTGISVAGITLVLMNSLLEVSPDEGRPLYLAVHAALISVSATIAPMVGAWMLDTFPIRLGFVICTVFRLATAPGFLWARTGGSQGNRQEATKSA